MLTGLCNYRKLTLYRSFFIKPWRKPWIDLQREKKWVQVGVSTCCKVCTCTSSKLARLVEFKSNTCKVWYIERCLISRVVKLSEMAQASGSKNGEFSSSIPWLPSINLHFCIAKGQLISKCLFGAIVWTKKNNEIFSRISALASKKRSNQKIKVLYYIN